MKLVNKRMEGREKGSAIILGLFLSIIAVALAVTSAHLLLAQRKEAESGYRLHGQALQIARSGLVEAANWLRKQPMQPVTSFAPQRDLSVSPAIAETDDPEIGLVRQFRINGGFWGRYEVWKPWDADPDPDRLMRRRNLQVEDVSEARGELPDGSAWRIKSMGYVFKLVDPSRPFNQAPNRVLGTELLESEVRRLVLGLPGASALNVNDGNSAHLNTGGRVIGGSKGAGITYPSNSGTPTQGPLRDERVTGNPGLSPIPDYDDSIDSLFGVSETQLRAMADLVVTDMADFPVPVPSMSIVFVDAKRAVFTADRPLLGSGIVVVSGAAHFGVDNSSDFSGMFYCKGNITMRAQCELSGTVVSQGNVTIQGAKDLAVIRYDDEVLDSLRLSLSNYRLAGAIRRSIVRD